MLKVYRQQDRSRASDNEEGSRQSLTKFAFVANASETSMMLARCEDVLNPKLKVTN